MAPQETEGLFNFVRMAGDDASRGPMVNSKHPMKQIADWALNVAEQRGATYSDLRIVDERSRALATKNGKVGGASDAESQGIGIRVLADGAWGFAASEDLSRASVEATTARAVDIAKASSKVKQTERPAGSRESRHGGMDYAASDRSFQHLCRTER